MGLIKLFKKLEIGESSHRSSAYDLQGKDLVNLSNESAITVAKETSFEHSLVLETSLLMSEMKKTISITSSNLLPSCRLSV